MAVIDALIAPPEIELDEVAELLDGDALIAPPEIELDEVAELLNGAADYIEQHGWCQHRMMGWGGSVCSYGAIRRAAGLLVGADLPVVGDALAMLNLWVGDDVMHWNDHQAGSAREVIITLREAARLKREELPEPLV